MITGAHFVIYSKDADADRAFLRDALGFPNVDAGGGWLIFGLPPAEVAVHPSTRDDVHELYLMTDDVDAMVATLQAKGVSTEPITTQPWGRLTFVALPGGGKLGMYQPRHARPPTHAPKAGAKKAAKTTSAKRPARKARASKPAAKRQLARRR